MALEDSDQLDKRAANVDLSRDLTDRNIFIYRMPPEWTEEDLITEFGEFGKIMSRKIMRRPDGESRGFAFVCYYEAEEAARAVKEMDGKICGNSQRRLKVSFKKTPEQCINFQVSKLLANSNPDGTRGTTLFVFHLPPEWDETEFRQQFSPFGAVDNVRIMKAEDGTHKGFGFVTYHSPNAAARALQNMSGLQVGGKRLKVTIKNPPPSASRSQSGSVPPGATLYPLFAFYLPPQMDDHELASLFSRYGRVASARVQRDEDGASKGFGFVNFLDAGEAIMAMQHLDGHSLGGQRTLRVSIKKGEEHLFPPIPPHQHQRGGVPPPPNGPPPAAEHPPPYDPPMLTHTPCGSYHLRPITIDQLHALGLSLVPSQAPGPIFDTPSPYHQSNQPPPHHAPPPGVYYPSAVLPAGGYASRPPPSGHPDNCYAAPPYQQPPTHAAPGYPVSSPPNDGFKSRAAHGGFTSGPPGPPAAQYATDPPSSFTRNAPDTYSSDPRGAPYRNSASPEGGCVAPQRRMYSGGGAPAPPAPMARPDMTYVVDGGRWGGRGGPPEGPGSSVRYSPY